MYDPEITDREMLNILRARSKAGVEIRVLGSIAADFDVEARKLSPMRLHTRAIIRDRHQAFIGSQSLHAPELDRRRELGLIIRDPKTVKKLGDIFDSDWSSSNGKECRPKKQESLHDEEKDGADLLTQQLDPLTATLKKTVKRVVLGAGEEALEGKEVKATVKKVVKKAVKEAIDEVAEETK